jgi:hypothetical protein
MKETFRRLVLLVIPACVAGISSPADGAIEYSLAYTSVPGTMDYVQKNLGTGAMDQFQDSAGFGSFGFRLAVGLPATLGPLTAVVEAGFGFPAGNQAFDHRNLVRNTAGKTRKDRHDGDMTSWSVATVPVLFVMRYARPSETVSLGGEVGFGPMVLGVGTERTFCTYMADGDTLDRSETERWQSAAVAAAVELSGLIVVPLAESLSLQVSGGLLWLSDVDYSVTRMSPNPKFVYGSSGPDPSQSPALEFGGLSFTARLGLVTGI